MKKVFRIYTEDVRFMAVVKPACDARFKAYTVIEAGGVWEGKDEASIIIEIIAPAIEAEKVYAIARDIKQQNQQQAVLVTSQDVQVELI